MSAATARFDREPDLAQLLGAVPRAKLVACLRSLIGAAWRIVDAEGKLVLQDGTVVDEPWTEAPLRLDLDAVGRLAAPQSRQRPAEVGARWLELVLASAWRYQMAADLHQEAVHADFAALQAKHAALLESEARYRALAAELEERVRKQVAVIETAQRQLYQAEKLAAVGTLAAGMAHEINNPVGFMRSNLGTAGTYFESLRATLEAFRQDDGIAAGALAWRNRDVDHVLEDFAELLDETAAGAERIAQIVADLQVFASINRCSRGPVDPGEVVQSALAMLRGRLPATVRLQVDLQPLPVVTGDPAGLNQVLYALLDNARLALAERGGMIRVGGRCVHGTVRIAVGDDGCGMSDEVRTRIFEPFFTTRGVGQGKGLGLAVSHDVVRAHGGHIEVQSSPGGGSVFTVCLPVRQTDEEEGLA